MAGKSPKKLTDLETEQKLYWDAFDRPFTTPFHVAEFMAKVPRTAETKVCVYVYRRTGEARVDIYMCVCVDIYATYTVCSKKKGL